MPSDDQLDAAVAEGKAFDSASRFRSIKIVLAVVLVGTVGLTLILPAFQTTGRRPQSQAWRNLRQISLSLANYEYAYGAYPYDSRGADYALYLLYADAQAKGWTLDAKFFDSHPHERPTPDARWDHISGRIIDSDFDYWNNPDPDGLLAQHKDGCPTVLVLERPAPGDKWLLFSTTEARIRSCGIPAGDYKKLFGTVETGNFLVANRELFNEWQQVRLPAGIPGTSQSSGNQLDSEEAGDVTMSYTYSGDHLKQRTCVSPGGKIIDSVTTDEIGRITGLSREPADWRMVLPVNGNSGVP